MRVEQRGRVGDRGRERKSESRGKECESGKERESERG